MLRILLLSLRWSNLDTKARCHDGRVSSMNKQSDAQQAKKRRLGEALRQNLGQRKRQERLRREDVVASVSPQNQAADQDAVVESETMR
jgi:hypothetical protein